MNKDNTTLYYMVIGFATVLLAMGGLMWQINSTIRDVETNLRNEFKSDIADLRTELKGDIARLEAQIADLRAELKGDIADLRMELKDDNAALKAELKGDIAALEASIEGVEANERYFLTELAHLRGAFESAQLISPRVGAPQSAPQAPSGG